MTDVPSSAAAAIIAAGRRMDALGFVPATAGNISVRLDEYSIAITASGGHQGFLTAAQVMIVDLEGQPRSPGKPSAETLLHCQLYRRFADVGAVLHGHSVPGTVLSMATPGDEIRLAQYELLKVFQDQTTHETDLALPLVDNDQDIARLARAMEPRLAETRLGYLIRGHGVYVWAPRMDMALARLEGLEFLLACELERRKLAR